MTKEGPLHIEAALLLFRGSRLGSLLPVLGRRTPLFLHEISFYKRPEYATGLAAENGFWKTPGQRIALRRRIPGFQVAGTLQTLITQDLVQKSGSSLTGISSERPWGAQKHAGGVFALLCYAERVPGCGSRGRKEICRYISIPSAIF